MKSSIYLRALLTGVAMTAASESLAQQAPPAAPQQASDTGSENVGLADIIVTANKRAQSINSVGLTISAASGDALLQRGITSTADLAKMTPGFTFTQSPYSTPVYTLRGIGLYDYSFGSSPSVAVYVDEVSLPFPVMSAGATLDLERVEVLKGPQGTLFGQSSTGGAINYIAAAPTDSFKAGGDISYERFGRVDASGFVSGPVTDTLKARFAARVVQGGNWQYSVSRPDDKNGASDQLFGRLLLDWQPTDSLRIRTNFNGWRDKSDTQQAQFVSNQLNIVAAPDARNPYARVDPAAFAALNDPSSPNYDPSFAGRQNTVFNRAAAGEAGALAYLAGPNGDGTSVSDNPRKAEWSPEYPTSSNDSFYQASVRADYDLSDSLVATSISSYQHAKINRYFDNDATTANALNENLNGYIKSFSQELRLTGSTDRFNWIVGGNYDWAKIEDNVFFNASDLSLNEALPGLRFNELNSSIRQTIKTYAAFANGEFKVTDQLTVLGGIRYTNSKRRALECNTDESAAQNLTKTFGNADIVPGFGFYDLQTAFGLPVDGHVVLQPGQCYALNDLVAPTDPAYLRPSADPYAVNLSEDNISFRAGANYKFDGGTLVYATVSQGYKSGIISGISPSTVSQYLPAKQEKVVAYEAGVKMPLFDRLLQLNAAAFYYDYSNKQVRARVRDNIFGLLESLVNVPKSRIWGLEAELVAQPTTGLNLSLSGTYLDSEVTKSFSSVGGRALYNQGGYTGDFKGSPLPYTAKFSGVADMQYEFPTSDTMKAFVGGTVTYTTKDNTTFRNDVLKADDYFRRAHALVDLRAGIAGEDDSWRLTAFGRNVFNKYYETTIFAGIESLYRYAGRPATYGLTLTVRTK